MLKVKIHSYYTLIIDPFLPRISKKDNNRFVTMNLLQDIEGKSYPHQGDFHVMHHCEDANERFSSILSASTYNQSRRELQGKNLGRSLYSDLERINNLPEHFFLNPFFHRLDPTGKVRKVGRKTKQQLLLVNSLHLLSEDDRPLFTQKEVLSNIGKKIISFYSKLPKERQLDEKLNTKSVIKHPVCQEPPYFWKELDGAKCKYCNWWWQCTDAV